MIEVLFNSLPGALLAASAVTLISALSKKVRLLPAVFLLGALFIGALCCPPRCALRSSCSTRPFLGFAILLCACPRSPQCLLSVSDLCSRHPGSRLFYVVRRTTLHSRKAALALGLLPLFLFSLVLVVTADTAFAFLFGWELMTLFSAALVMIDGCEGERRRNIFIYLLMMHVGAAAVFGAFLGFLPHAAALDFGSLRASAPLLTATARSAIFLLAFVGFGVKAGIVPLHLWLPKAHPIAPSPVSALMSGVMLKTAVYGFIRFAFDLLGNGAAWPGPAWWGYLVLAAGAVSALLGVLYAISEHDLKRLLAYHSVENIGIIYMGLGAAMIFTAQHAPAWALLALMGALLHSLNHALFKSLLFLGAGAIADATHTQDLEELGGLLKQHARDGNGLSRRLLLDCWFAAVQRICQRVAYLPQFHCRRRPGKRDCSHRSAVDGGHAGTGRRIGRRLLCQGLRRRVSGPPTQRRSRAGA